MEALLSNQHLLKDHIRAKLLKQRSRVRFSVDSGKTERPAAVLFLLGMHRLDPALAAEPCLIFNQRSRHVRQPGDLCFPGGGLAPYLDAFLAGFLSLPGLPLFRWSSRARRNLSRRKMPRGMPRLLATSLRESFEEMRINPFRIRFLGPMAPEDFTRLNRTIYPMVAWHCGQKAFSPNWEVERIVYIPLRRFFLSAAYARLPVFHLPRFKGRENATPVEDFPCLIYDNGENREILWGLTYRIVMRFLDLVFDFRPPDTSSLPVASKQ